MSQRDNPDDCLKLSRYHFQFLSIDIRNLAYALQTMPELFKAESAVTYN